MPAAHIVIVTAMVDPHADVIVKALGELGHEPVRLNLSDVPGEATLTAELATGRWQGRLRIETNGRAIDWDAVTAVWWRKPAGYGLPPELSEWEREFAEEELDHALRGMWATLDCYWMSRPEAIASASYKVEQLARAARLGFDVPHTIVTSDPAHAREFYRQSAGRVVYKVLTDPFLMRARTLRRHPDADCALLSVTTTLLGDAELENLKTVRTVPCLFQEYVEKHSEFRVTVIGDDVFVAEIDSQSCPESRVDWRVAFGRPAPFRASRLPADVLDRCVALVRSYGLEFSALDLILTPDGRYVFLENNPNGQFLFVEERAPDLRMAQAMAARLIRGKGR